MHFLQNNIKPENTKYQYDFLFNNCATKITEVLNEVLDNKIVYNRNHITTDYTFRDLINNNMMNFFLMTHLQVMKTILKSNPVELLPDQFAKRNISFVSSKYEKLLTF